MTKRRAQEVALLASLLCAQSAGAALTSGFDFNVDAGSDTDGNAFWENTVATTLFSGAQGGFGLATGVNRVTGTSALPGISAAYSFPGGATGNNGGALLQRSDNNGTQSFNGASGNFSDESVSLELWFRPDALSPANAANTNGQILFEDGGGTGLGFFLAPGGNLQLRVAGFNPGALSGTISTDVSPLASEFIQAVATFDVASGDLELFINGTSAGTDSVGIIDWTGGDPAALGTLGGGNVGGIGGGQQSTESFDGEIAIFRVYRDQILTAAEVQANFDAIAIPEPSAASLVFLLSGVAVLRRGRRTC